MRVPRIDEAIRSLLPTVMKKDFDMMMQMRQDKEWKKRKNGQDRFLFQSSPHSIATYHLTLVHRPLSNRAYDL